jgi:hypothetical protein
MAVAYQIRDVRMRKERDLIRHAGFPHDLATAECAVTIPIDQRGRIHGAARISC